VTVRSALATLAALGCGASPRTTVVAANDPSDDPGVLHDPRTLAHEFSVRQHLAIHAERDGRPIDGELDAVLQKQGDTLLLVGFGPMNVKAFTLTQRGDRIELVQFLGPDLPFSPRNVVVDLHRVYFKHLRPPTDAAYAGVQRGELDGEHVEETWQGGELRARVFTRPGARRGAVRVELGPGCTATRCEPREATLRNEWFGYTLVVTSEGYEPL
jgi:hypothetical protein